MKPLKHKLTTGSSIGQASLIPQLVCGYQLDRRVVENKISLGVEELMGSEIPSQKGAVSPINKFHSNI
jgi:hypothetical protein